MSLTLTGCYPISGNEELNEMCIWDSVQECRIANNAAEERLKSYEQHLDSVKRVSAINVNLVIHNVAWQCHHLAQTRHGTSLERFVH